MHAMEFSAEQIPRILSKCVTIHFAHVQVDRRDESYFNERH